MFALTISAKNTSELANIAALAEIMVKPAQEPDDADVPDGVLVSAVEWLMSKLTEYIALQKELHDYVDSDLVDSLTLNLRRAADDIQRIDDVVISE